MLVLSIMFVSQFGSGKVYQWHFKEMKPTDARISDTMNVTYHNTLAEEKSKNPISYYTLLVVVERQTIKH